MVERVSCTPAAEAVIAKLKAIHGSWLPSVGRLLRRQRAHVLCGGRVPLGGAGYTLGEIAGCPFFMGAAQFEYW